MQFDEVVNVLDLDTGAVESLSIDLMRKAEEAQDDTPPAELPKWQADEWLLARRMVFRKNFIALPNRFDKEPVTRKHSWKRSLPIV